MSQELRTIQISGGATIESHETWESISTFGNDESAFQAAEAGVAIYDRSHWGRIQLQGDDRLRYLHNQSTANFYALKPGEGCDTVFLTSTGRTIDLATAYLLEEAVWLLVSPNRRHQLMTWMDRYLFPADKVKLSDITGQTLAFSLLGPESQTLLDKLNLRPAGTYANHQVVTWDDLEVRIAVGSGLATTGYTLLAEATQAAALWQRLIAAGATPLGDRVWEQLRICQGRPAADAELTEDYNPLESALWHIISFDKGCYIGQETIARLNTYKGIKTQLWGLRLTNWADVGSPLMLAGNKVGLLTSVAETTKGYVGLAYLRTKAGGLGTKVQVGEAEAEVVDVPFLSRPAYCLHPTEETSD